MTSEEAEGELRRLLAAHGVAVALEREEYECSQAWSAAEWRMSGPLTVGVADLMPLLEHLSQGAGGTAAELRRAIAAGKDIVSLRTISLQAGPDFSC